MPSKKWPVVLGLMLSMFLIALDGTIVSTAMPTIAGELNGFALYAWVPSIYLLTQAVSTPLYGKIADLFGRKRVLFLGIGLFLLGSVTSGAAPSMQALIVFRALQGLGAGAVFPITITVIGDIFSLEQRARIQGIFSSVWAIASVLGPLLGGTLVDNVGWRWIFYLNIPVGLVAVFLIGVYFHERRVVREHQLDLLGATVLTGGLVAVLLCLIEGGVEWSWASWETAALLLVAVLCGGLLVWQERRAVEPVLPLDLFTSRIIAVSVIAGFFAGMVMICVTFEIPLYIQGILGQDAVHAGLALAPMSIGWPLAASVSGRIAIRTSYRTVALVGFLLDVIGVGLLLTLGTGSGFWPAAVFSFLIGVGLGISTTPLLVAVQSAVLWARRGVATATNAFMRTFGSVAGLAIMGAIINNVTSSIRGSSATNQSLQLHTKVPPAVLEHIRTVLLSGIHNAFFAAFAAAVIAVGISAFLPRGSARLHEVRDEAESPVPPESIEQPA